MDIHAKGLIQKDVVEHKFTGDGRKGGKGHTLLYSHTRMRARREQISTGRKGRIAVSHSRRQYGWTKSGEETLMENGFSIVNCHFSSLTVIYQWVKSDNKVIIEVIPG